MKHSGNAAAFQPAWTIFPELEPVPSGVLTRLRGWRKTPTQPANLNTSVEQGGRIKAATLSISNMNGYGDLLVRFLKARKETFIDRLGWNLPQTEGMEFDQYDTPFCHWVVIHEFGEILGGVRLIPTTARCGVYSYMLRDAQNGILENIPTDVLFFPAPSEDRIWEASRLFIAPSVPAQRRHFLQKVLMERLSSSARDLGAMHVIGIVPAVWSRWLRRLDLGAVPVGPRFSIEGTQSQAALFNVANYLN